MYSSFRLSSSIFHLPVGKYNLLYSDSHEISNCFSPKYAHVVSPWPVACMMGWARRTPRIVIVFCGPQFMTSTARPPSLRLMQSTDGRLAGCSVEFIYH